MHLETEVRGRQPTKRIYRWMLSFLSAYRPLLLGVIVTGLLVTGVEMSLPLFLQTFIDNILPNRDLHLFLRLVIGVVVMVGFMFVAQSYLNRWERTLGEQAARDLQMTLFQHLRRVGFSYYEQHAVGDTLNLFNADVDAVQKVYRQYLPQMIKQLIIVLVTGSIMATLSVRLTLLILASCLLYYLIGPYFERKATLYFQNSTRLYAALSQTIYDNVAATQEVRAYSREAWTISRMMDRYNEFASNGVKRNFWAYMRGAVRRLSIAIGASSVFVYGAVLVKNGALTVGGFVSYMFYCFILVRAFSDVITMSTEQRLLLVQAGRLHDLWSVVPDVQERETPVLLPAMRGELQFENVSFGYPSRPHVLDSVSLHIQPGERVAFVGESGSGKSTLLKLVARFYDASAGTVRMDGVDVRDLSLEQLRSGIGYVFQDTYLFGTTILENIRFGDPHATDAQVFEAARLAKVSDFIDELPEGWQTLVGERGVKLSGGQKQRLAIARMLLKNPSVVLLDEATSALDNITEIAVQAALNELLQGRTTLIVAHRLSTVRHADRIVVVANGRIAEVGTYEELMERGGAFYQLAEGTAREVAHV